MSQRPLVAPFDLLTSLLLIFVILTLLGTIKPPQAKIDTLGIYAVTLEWDRGAYSDLDLYVKRPNGEVIFFGNKDSDYVFLEHDDLGSPDNLNYERILIRGEERGEYIINIHAYNFSDNKSIRAKVTLWRLRGEDRLLKTEEIEISYQGQERTVFRFTPPNKFNDLQMSLVG